MFAIIESGGKQYKISEGDIIRVEKLIGEPDSKIKIDKVLLFAKGKKISIGKPYLDNITVTTVKVNDVKNKKLTVYKYKRRKSFLHNAQLVIFS